VETVTRSLPGVGELTSALAILLGVARDDVTVLDRTRNDYASTFPSEKIRISVDGDGRSLFCKYTGDRSHTSFGHRGDVAYEAQIYAAVLARTALTVPAYVGSFDDDVLGTCLVVEHVDDGVLADEAESPAEAIVNAAAWVVGLQDEAAPIVESQDCGFVRRYDAEYYRQWARRTATFAGHWHARLPWLAPLCERFDSLAEELASGPTAFVHGEFVPHNILVRGADVFPIDWESAAIGLPEIDVVSVTDKWPDELRRRCEAAYRAAMTTSVEPAELDRRFDMARAYWDLRWLGDRPEWTVLEKVGARFEHLRQAGDRLGLLP